MSTSQDEYYFPFDELLEWYKTNGRTHLPWREGLDSYNTAERTYRVWLAEILLQQTQAERVVLFYTKILAAFPTIQSLENASYEEFFPYYQGLGYYSRARNMLKTAKAVVEVYSGIFPSDEAKLLALPGIGAYTARAILAFGHNQSVLAWDTNVRKVFARYFLGSRFVPLSNTIVQSLEQTVAQKHLEGRVLNAALMDYATLVSKNSAALVPYDAYGISGCKFFAERGAQERERESTKPKTFPTRDATIVAIVHQNHKEYYSSQATAYVPFFIPNTNGEADVRKCTKEYFEQQYHLAVSVRPPHYKAIHKSGAYVCVHVQVQAGTHAFWLYWASAYKTWKHTWQENADI